MFCTVLRDTLCAWYRYYELCYETHFPCDYLCCPVLCYLAAKCYDVLWRKVMYCPVLCNPLLCCSRLSCGSLHSDMSWCIFWNDIWFVVKCCLWYCCVFLCCAVLCVQQGKHKLCGFFVLQYIIVCHGICHAILYCVLMCCTNSTWYILLCVLYCIVMGWV